MTRHAGHALNVQHAARRNASTLAPAADGGLPDAEFLRDGGLAARGLNGCSDDITHAVDSNTESVCLVNTHCVFRSADNSYMDEDRGFWERLTSLPPFADKSQEEIGKVAGVWQTAVGKWAVDCQHSPGRGRWRSRAVSALTGC